MADNDNRSAAVTASGGASWPMLRQLPGLARLGVMALMLLIIGGLAASGAHLFFHDQNRDEQAGLTVTDIKGVYHGVVSTSPLLTSLQSGHPETLQAKDRETLIAWLQGNRIAEDYDNLDLGDAAPGEMIGASCVSCHSRLATGKDAATSLPLERWADVKRVAFSKDIRPNDVKILAASTHTHALSLGTLAVMLSMLLLMTTWSRGLVSLLVCAMGLGLTGDMAAWWISRSVEGAIYAIIACGAIFIASMSVASLMVIVELFKPKR